MEISHTDPGRIAVPFAELAQAAQAWDDAGRLIDDRSLGTVAAASTSCGPEVGPVLASRLERWRAEVACISRAMTDHAKALRLCAATSSEADADVARRFG
jgi:hypothetical protein